MIPQRSALISAGNILRGVGWKFQAAKHSSWERRSSRRVGKQDRGGACSSQASLLHSSCPLFGGISSHRLVFFDSVFCCHGGRREPRMGEPSAWRKSSCWRRKGANWLLPVTEHHSPGSYPWLVFKSSTPSRRKMSKSDVEAGLKSAQMTLWDQTMTISFTYQQYRKEFFNVSRHVWVDSLSEVSRDVLNTPT